MILGNVILYALLSILPTCMCLSQTYTHARSYMLLIGKGSGAPQRAAPIDEVCIYVLWACL